ncbi:preprotein translocase subunit YajC [Arthrobacter agilis]|nr:preprotein translocase subunit YajC [Arthrobacter agilis]
MFSLLLPLALAFLIFTMFRRQRKAQKEVKEMRTHMEPGTEVMTQFGLFGTIVSIDQENNKAVLELSPGNLATVHTQALSKVVQQEPAAADDVREDATLTGTPAAEDTSSFDAVDRTPSAGSTAAGTAGTTSGVETPEETLERLNRQSAQENRDARDPRNPTANPDN